MTAGKHAKGKRGTHWPLLLPLLLVPLLLLLRGWQWPDMPWWVWQGAFLLAPTWGWLLWRWPGHWAEATLRWATAGAALMIGILSFVNGGPLHGGGAVLALLFGLFSLAADRGRWQA